MVLFFIFMCGVVVGIIAMAFALAIDTKHREEAWEAMNR